VLYIILITISIIGLILSVPSLTRFFEFEKLSFNQLIVCSSVGFISVIWFEVVKWIKRLQNPAELMRKLD
jgi:Ca2+-transporting ATPase